MTEQDEPNTGGSGEFARNHAMPLPADTGSRRISANARELITRRVRPRGALVLILAIGIALFFCLSLAASQVYSAVTDSDGVAGLDRPALDLALALRTPWLDTFLTWYTNAAGKIGMPAIAIAALLIFTIRQKSWTPALLILAAAGGSLLMTVAGKLIFGRDRPPLADAVPPYEYSASFPSGHTLNATAIIGIIAYLLVLRQTSRTLRVVTISIAAFVILTTGLTRIFLGHHWFTDVLFAWFLGLAWLVLIITAHRIYLALRRWRGDH